MGWVCATPDEDGAQVVSSHARAPSLTTCFLSHRDLHPSQAKLAQPVDRLRRGVAYLPNSGGGGGGGGAGGKGKDDRARVELDKLGETVTSITAFLEHTLRKIKQRQVEFDRGAKEMVEEAAGAVRERGERVVAELAAAAGQGRVGK